MWNGSLLSWDGPSAWREQPAAPSHTAVMWSMSGSVADSGQVLEVAEVVVEDAAHVLAWPARKMCSKCSVAYGDGCYACSSIELPCSQLRRTSAGGFSINSAHEPYLPVLVGTVG